MNFHDKSFEIMGFDHEACHKYATDILNNYHLHRRWNIVLMVFCALMTIAALARGNWLCVALLVCVILCSVIFLVRKYHSAEKSLTGLYVSIHSWEYLGQLVDIELDESDRTLAVFWLNPDTGCLSLTRYELITLLDPNVTCPVVDIEAGVVFYPSNE